jgi:hypothetical protein
MLYECDEIKLGPLLEQVEAATHKSPRKKHSKALEALFLAAGLIVHG